MASTIHSYLVNILVWSVPFYLLNYFYPKPLFLNLPASFIMIFVPCFLAGIAIYQESQQEGIKEWLTSVVDFSRIELYYLLAAILILPIIYLTAYTIDNGFSALSLIVTNPDLSFLNISLTFLLFWVGAVIEELGWTNYATPPLQNQHGILGAGLLIGIYWGLWHVIPYYSQGRSRNEILLLVISSVAYRVIMGYLFYYSGYATVTGIIFHTFINFTPEILPGGYQSFKLSTVALLLWIFVGILILMDFPRRL